MQPVPFDSHADPLPWPALADQRSEPSTRVDSGDGEQDVLFLYDLHAEALARYVIGATEDADLAAEVVQECFLRYLSHRRSGGTEVSSRTWLFREVRRQIRRHLHWRESGPAVTSGQQAVRHIPDARSDPERASLAGEMLRILRSVAAPRELECALLRAGGLEYEEIAEIMGITTGAVGAMLARAVRKLQNAVKKGAT